MGFQSLSFLLFLTVTVCACLLAGRRSSRPARAVLCAASLVFYLSGTQPTGYCNMHRAVTVCAYSHQVASGGCHNTRVFGMIFIPEGHPLRNATSLTDVTNYFTGASTNESSTSLGRCTLGR